MTQSPLQELRAKPIYGNAYMDGPALLMANHIIRDQSLALADRLEALTILDRIVGNSVQPLYSMENIQAYTKECQQ